MVDEPKKNWEQLTPDVMEAFLADCLNKGFSPTSLETCRRNLTKRYNYLPEDKHITAGTGPERAAWMKTRGVAPRSVNDRISLWNMYRSTRNTILNSFSVVVDQTYDRMMEDEDRTSGWDKW